MAANAAKLLCLGTSPLFSKQSLENKHKGPYVMRTATVTRSSEIFIFNDMKTVILASGSRPAGALFFY